MNSLEAQRIDKWLWHARFARTRSAAQRLAASGHVRVNREKVMAPSRLVRPGDVLTLALGGGVKVIRVCGIAERRGGAEEARQLYDEPRAGRS
jgi:ribosome-associated heat shock protein Hsp15